MNSISRTRKTRWMVLASEHISRIVITACGLSTIVAVLGVCVFLVWNVVPLFAPAKLTDERQAQLSLPSARMVRLGMDEYRKMGWALFENGELDLFRLDSGDLLDQQHLFTDDAKLTAVSMPEPQERVYV